MELASDRERVKEWLYNLVLEFREKSSQLTDLEKKSIEISEDYRAPCQLEVFWMKDPEWQFLVVTKSEKRKDLEITVNGPYEAYRFLDETEKIMEEQRWKEKVSLSQFEEKIFGPMSYADCFGIILHGQIVQIKNFIFRMEPKTRFWGGSRLSPPGGWVHFIEGNIADLDQNEYLSKLFNWIRERTKSLTQERFKESETKKTYIIGYGTYFYPPIWIERIPKPTFRQRVERSIGLPLFDKAFDCNFQQYRLIFNTDGLFTVDCESKEEALRIFNCILATTFLMGIETNAITENEIAKIYINPDEFIVTGREDPETPSLRTLLGEPVSERAFSLHYTQEVISKIEVLDIVDKAEKIFQEPGKLEQAIFLLQANTHLMNSEYSQAFTFAWLLIERYIHNLWEEFLGQRRVKLQKSRSVHDVLKNLNRNGLLGKEEYDLLNKMKEQRNSFVHHRKTISKNAAEKCVGYTFDLVKKNLL